MLPASDTATLSRISRPGKGKGPMPRGLTTSSAPRREPGSEIRRRRSSSQAFNRIRVNASRVSCGTPRRCNPTRCIAASRLVSYARCRFRRMASCFAWFDNRLRSSPACSSRGPAARRADRAAGEMPEDPADDGRLLDERDQPSRHGPECAPFPILISPCHMTPAPLARGRRATQDVCMSRRSKQRTLGGRGRRMCACCCLAMPPASAPGPTTR